jgi:peptide/nickel transport system permease protein
MLASIVLFFFAFVAVFRAQLAGDPWEMVGAPFQPPGIDHMLGTDSLGRDILSGIVFGARTSLYIGLTATAVSTALGLLVGAVAGYYGGWFDEVLMRATEFVQVYPGFIFTLVLVTVFSPTLLHIVMAIAVASWPGTARLVRAEVMAYRDRDFVVATTALGAATWRILRRHVIPNAIPAIVVHSSMMVGTAILIESALSFLGLGDPNEMSWGYMIGASRGFLRHAWWTAFAPGVAIVAVVLSLNIVGDCLNDLLNPRQALAELPRPRRWPRWLRSAPAHKEG